MTRLSIDLPDGSLSAIQFGDPSDPLGLIFCHANGFNAQVYRSVITPTLEGLGRSALALDLRGHGQTQLPTDVDALSGWQIFADDIAAIFDRKVDQPVVLAGHSYGAVSGILALPQIKEKVVGYAGFDPVLVPWLFRQIARSRTGRAYMKKRIPIARKAGQRKNQFESLEAAFTRYQGRGAFKGVPDPVLRDYLTGGLIPHGDGMRLACDPMWEQAIFAAQAHNIFKKIPLLPDNAHIVFAGAQGRVSTDGQRKAIQRLQPGITVDYEKDRAHLFPIQDPDFAAQVLRGVLEKAF
ncbi:MAG: alpha/beta hydrolase [Pseudomonadota bacterium]